MSDSQETRADPSLLEQVSNLKGRLVRVRDSLNIAILSCSKLSEEVVRASADVGSTESTEPANNLGDLVKSKIKRHIDRIIIHCSYTRPSQDIGAEEITKWHKDRGFDTIGYHYVITRDGLVELGRDVETAGAHARGYNRWSIGICLVGGMNEDNPRPEDNFEDIQRHSMVDLVAEIFSSIGRVVEVVGHRDLPGVKKDCPCFDVSPYKSEMVRRMRAVT